MLSGSEFAVRTALVTKYMPLHMRDLHTPGTSKIVIHEKVSARRNRLSKTNLTQKLS
jgi:hypothetical protein